MKRNFQSSIITWPGSLFWLPGGLLLWQLFETRRRQIAMTSINQNGYRILGLLLDEGFYFDTARILTAQAAHETGNFTSQIFRENNNAFGMKLPAQRRTTAIGENKKHAVYRSVADSVKDFWLYYKYSQLPEIWSSVLGYVEAI